MLRNDNFAEVSDEEHIKKSGLILDLDELSRSGKMGQQEALVAKWYGIYKSRQAGEHMARIVIPGGKITSDQAFHVATLAQRYSNGKVNVTTRQALQYHQLKIGELAGMTRDLAKENLTTFHGCGDVTRIVTTCPLAETCTHRRLDVRPHAEDMQQYLGSCRDLDDLPRKFKINFSGCGAACGLPYLNCLGFIAVSRPGADGKPEAGFRVTIGGGMGWKAYVAQELFSFVPLSAVRPLARAVALLFRDNGDRLDRTKSRLKVVVERLGLDACRAIVLEQLQQEGVPVAELLTAPVTDNGIPWPKQPLLDATLATDKDVVRVRIPKGELPAKDLAAFAALAEEFADQHLYASVRQNLEFHGVLPGKRAPLQTAVQALGYATRGHFGLADIVCCVGTTFCPKAVSPTRELYDALAAVVAEAEFADIADFAIINITGCPNSCSPYRVADIGFRGKRIRQAETGSLDGYDVLLGGDQRAHGLPFGEFATADCPDMVRHVLRTFKQLRLADEQLRDTVARVGITPFGDR